MCSEKLYVLTNNMYGDKSRIFRPGGAFMRILWICNLVLPEFSEVFSIKHTCYGGWMSGMLTALSEVNKIEIGCCFPIIDEIRMKSGGHNGYKYYSFHASMDKEYNDTFVHEFVAIYRDFSPDIIYVWGTEYPHARVAVAAAIAEGILDRVIVHIQGYVGYCAIHYANGIPKSILTRVDDKGRYIEQEIKNFMERGKNERWIIQHICHVCGRTEWDRICSEEMNPDVVYHSCGEILRGTFYQYAGMWSLNSIKRHRIFLSQAAYPVKGLHLFLKSLPILITRFPDMEVHIGGMNLIDSNSSLSSYGMYINDSIQSYGLEGVVKFLGNLTEKEMLTEYIQANVFVSSSVIENSSNSIGEAMLVGCPVVASYVGGTPSLLSHLKEGLLYPYDEYYTLAGYIRKIFEDDAFAKSISEQAKETAKIRYNISSIKNRMCEIYEDVARSRKG